MATNNEVVELFERYSRIENEIKLLQEDKKLLLAEFKEKIEPKTFQVALRAAKSISKLKSSEMNDFDQIMEILQSQLCVEHLD